MAESAADRYDREWGHHTTSVTGDNRKDRALDSQGGEVKADGTPVANGRTNRLFVAPNGSTNVNINN